MLYKDGYEPMLNCSRREIMLNRRYSNLPSMSPHKAGPETTHHIFYWFTNDKKDAFMLWSMLKQVTSKNKTSGKIRPLEKWRLLSVNKLI